MRYIVFGLWFMVLLFTIYYLPSTTYASDIDIGSSRIHPASPLYFLKTIREGIEMHFAQTPRVKWIRQLEFATRRLREVNSLIWVKREDLIQATLERYWSHISFLPDKDLNDADVQERVQEDLKIDLQFLQRSYSQLSDPKAKIAFRSAINRILQRHDVTEDARASGCSFLAKEASSSALTEPEREILSQRAQICLKI